MLPPAAQTRVPRRPAQMAMPGIAYFAAETRTQTGRRGSSRGMSPLTPIPQRPSLAHASGRQALSSACWRSMGKRGETATTAQAQLTSGAQRYDAGASLSLLVLESNFQPLRYGYQHDDVQVEVDRAVQGRRRPCLLSSSCCRLTLGRPLFRPPSTARHRRIETRWKRQDAHDDGDDRVSSHAPEAAPQHGAENEEDTAYVLPPWSTGICQDGRGSRKKPRSLDFDDCFSHLSRGSPFRLLLTKSYDVCRWELDLFPWSRFCGFTLFCAHPLTLVRLFSLDVSRISFCRVRALRSPSFFSPP